VLATLFLGGAGGPGGCSSIGRAATLGGGPAAANVEASGWRRVGANQEGLREGGDAVTRCRIGWISYGEREKGVIWGGIHQTNTNYHLFEG
jgi:hypothetical protein